MYMRQKGLFCIMSETDSGLKRNSILQDLFCHAITFIEEIMETWYNAMGMYNRIVKTGKGSSHGQKEGRKYSREKKYYGGFVKADA